MFDYYSGLKVLVTGGAGFVGSHLVDRLVALNADVTVLDNLHTGKLANLQPHLDSEQIRFIEHDIKDAFDIPADLIFNLACPASPIKYQEDPIQTWQTSVIGGHNVVQLAARYDARLVQMSTSEVYGDPAVHPQTEDYWGHVNPVGPRACYDEGKRALETLAMDFHRSRGLKVRIARVFNTYGPRMLSHDGRVISTFIDQALKNADITVFGDGSQTRSFCYVSDLVEGVLRLGALEGLDGQIINLGNPEEYSVLQIARKILDMTASQSTICFLDGAIDDPTRRQPDITKASNLLGWKPEIEINLGLTNTISYLPKANA